MYIKAIKTEIITAGSSLIEIIDKYVKNISPNSVIAISSKIVSISQSRIIATKTIDRDSLIAKEADSFMMNASGEIAPLTIKDSRLMPFAGIDESNGDEFFVLYPDAPMDVAYDLWQYLKQKFEGNIGVIITDSNITPLRKGVTGIAVAWAGINPVISYIGKEDLFGRKMQLTNVNVVDSLANMAVFAMGEGAESTPIAVLADMDKVEFIDTIKANNDSLEAVMEEKQDFYYPLLSAVNWHRNK